MCVINFGKNAHFLPHFFLSKLNIHRGKGTRGQDDTGGARELGFGTHKLENSFRFCSKVKASGFLPANPKLNENQ